MFIFFAFFGDSEPFECGIKAVLSDRFMLEEAVKSGREVFSALGREIGWLIVSPIPLLFLLLDFML